MRTASTLFLALALVLFGCDDGGTADPDSGVTPGVDAGPPGVDGGGGDRDGGLPPGTDGGPSADDGGGGTPPGDAGGGDGGPGTGCATGTIRIEDVSCPAFTRCGGALAGAWCYSDICMTEAELVDSILSQPGVPSSCNADGMEVRSASGTIDGSIAITAADITRDVESMVNGTFYLSGGCTLGTCGFTEIALNSALGANGTATCTDEAPGCLCDITFMSTVNSVDTYSLADDTITFDGSGRTFEYCVDSGNLVFRETTEGGEPGTQTAVPMSSP